MVFEEFNNFRYDNNDEEFINEYVVTHAKYLSSSNFDLIKKKMAELAKRGHIRSLAKYLFRVEPEKWAEDLKKIAFAIQNKKGPKTPQEWEVVAAMQFHYALINSSYDDIKDVRNLRIEICKAGKDFYCADRSYRAGLIDDGYFYGKKVACMRLTELYNNQPYLQTLKKVQEGYYSAFIKNGNILDGVGFLECTLDPDDFFIDKERLKEYCDGRIYSRHDVANVLIKNFDSYKKNEDVPYDAFYAYGFANVLYGKNEKTRHVGMRVLNIVSKFSFDDEKTNIAKSKEKEKNN